MASWAKQAPFLPSAALGNMMPGAWEFKGGIQDGGRASGGTHAINSFISNNVCVESQAQGLVGKRKTLPKYAASSSPQEVRARATAAA